jgi:hypothetical protein
MEHSRFDALAIGVGRATSRRQVLKVGLSTAFAALGSGGLRIRAVAQTPTPSQTPNPPNFSFLVPLPTDPDLESFGLNQKLTGPPTMYRSARAMTHLTAEQRSDLGENLAASYISTIATTRDGDPDQSSRAITTTIIDYGTEEQAQAAFTQYSSTVIDQPGVQPMNVDSGGGSGSNVVFGGCFTGCIDLSSPAPSSTPPAQEAIAVGQRGRFMFDARIRDFQPGPLGTGDIATIASLVDGKIQLAAPPALASGNAIGRFMSRLLSSASVGAAPILPRRRRLTSTEQLQALFVPETTLPIFGLGDGAVPRSASQWLIVDRDQIVKAYGDDDATAADKQDDVAGVACACGSSQVLPLDDPYLGGYELRLFSVQYAVNDVPKLGRFMATAEKRLTRRRPNADVELIDSNDRLQIFRIVDPTPEFGPSFGLQVIRYYPVEDDIFVVAVEVVAVPLSRGLPEIGDAQLTSDFMPILESVGKDLAECALDPSNCGDARRVPVPDSLRCPTGQIVCNDVCIDPSADVFNCGQCGFICAQNAICASGSCICPQGTSYCTSGICTDFDTDSQNCGACGNSCQGGECCSGSCADLSQDVQNCGACGLRCESGVPCLNGSCGCPPGTLPCPAGCVNPADDPMNCGDCGIVCEPGLICLGGACYCPDGSEPCGRQCCDPGTEMCSGLQCVPLCPYTMCPGGCYDLTSDPNNCGNCGLSCGGLTCCSGVCTDLANDDNNCGGCGVDCGGGWYCSGSQCYPIIG